MSLPEPGAPRTIRGLLLGALGATFLAMLPTVMADADTDPGYVIATATFGSQVNVPSGGTITGLTDLDDVALTFQATGAGNQVTKVQIRQCRDGSDISSFDQFRPTIGGKCIAPSNWFHPPVEGGFVEAVPDDPPALQHVAATFEVGTGTAPSANEDGPVADIVCGAASPCELWARVSQPQSALEAGESYVHWDLQFAGGTTSSTSSTSSTSTTVGATTSTTTPATTSTTAPATTTTTVDGTTTTTAPATTTTTVGGTTTTTVPATTTTTVDGTTTTTIVGTTTTAAPGSTTTSTTAAGSSTTSTTKAGGSTTTSTPNTSTTSTTLPAGTTLSPTSVAAGGGLTISSTGWQANQPVAVTLRSDPVSLPAITADATGKISGTITIPAGTPAGMHSLELVGKDMAGVSRTVTASITVTAASSTTAAGATTTTRATPALPSTGGRDTLRLIWTSTGFLLAGALFVEAARRRRPHDRSGW